MTNRAISQTPTLDRSDRRSRWSYLLRNWIVRRKVRQLQDHDDRILDDIGVTRDEVAWASHLPLSVNSARELDKAAYRRRKEQQLMWL